jgi:hypothetical protein
MRIRIVLLVVAAAALSGCLNSEVGDYRLDDVIAFAASCTSGIESQRASIWTEAVSAEVLDDMLVVRGDGVPTGTSQVQFLRSSDRSSFWTDVEGNDDRQFTGTGNLEATSVADAHLGADFSALLEPDALGCRFDLDVTTTFDYGEDGWDVVTGEVIIELSQTTGLVADPCEMGTCMVEYRFAGVHTSGIGGDRLSEGADEEE